MSDSALANRRILVPESRELDLFCRMLEAEGAVALRCPMVAILPVEDPRPALEWLGRLAAGMFDDLILLTGEGLRRLLVLAREAGTEDAVIAAVGRLRTVTRGPKPARALREIGLAPGLAAATPTTEGVIETLSAQDLAGDLAGRRVAVQLYPGNPNALLLDFLRDRGAEPDAIVPYRYASDADDGAIERAIRDMAAGTVDLIAFTSSPQVKRLVDVARERGIETLLHEALARTRIAAVGPVAAEAVRAIGAAVSVEPENSFHLKPLVGAMRAALAQT